MQEVTRRRLARWAMLLAGILILLGQAVARSAQSTPPPQAPPKTTEPAKPPAPENTGAVGAPVDPKTYEIGAEDVLFVRVWREADFTGPVGVRPDGKISMPLVGELQAAGLTPERLGTHIAEALKKYITNPDVSVSVSQVNSKRYYITGEVNRPGPYPLVTPTRVLEALANAGGFRDFANLKKIKILRGKQQFKFNYKEVTSGKRLEQNIYLESGDYIIVP